MTTFNIKLAELQAVAADYMEAEQDLKSHPEYNNGYNCRSEKSAEYQHTLEYYYKKESAFYAICYVLDIDSEKLLKWARSLRKYAESTKWQLCIFPDRFSAGDYRKTIEYLKTPEESEREAKANYVKWKLKRYFDKKLSA